MPALVLNNASESRLVVTRDIAMQPGPQTLFEISQADILIYGGSAGGGKSFALAKEPLRHAKVPGFRAGIFRRTSPQLTAEGGIFEEASALYRHFGAVIREGQHLDATFMSGARVGFHHLQHEKSVHEHQSTQYALIEFDELTHFSMKQFFYMLSRNRTTCGIRPYVRCGCNPDAGSWVAEFIAWWIDQETGYPIATKYNDLLSDQYRGVDRAGVLRYFVRDEDQFHWAGSKAELINSFPQYKQEDILSVTFIPASLDDNPALTGKDPGYKGRLLALPRIERDRLLGGNWKIREGAIIEHGWLRRYTLVNGYYRGEVNGINLNVNHAECRRIATIDTAGTSKEKAAVQRGDPPSYSVCAVWDFYTKLDILFLVHVWRSLSEWNELKLTIPRVLRDWKVGTVVIEDAHYGRPLASECKSWRCVMSPTKMPGQGDSTRGAKLERAVASGCLTRLENGKIIIPADDFAPWVPVYVRELTVWTGLPKETADQIDVTSHASNHAKTKGGSWGGTIPPR